jgi:hypothetical protein
MPVARVKLYCPWCGAKLQTMDTTERIKEKRTPGSRIERSVARCPKCAKIIQLKEPPVLRRWHRWKLWGAWAIALAVVICIAIVAYVMRGQ